MHLHSGTIERPLLFSGRTFAASQVQYEEGGVERGPEAGPSFFFEWPKKCLTTTARWHMNENSSHQEVATRIQFTLRSSPVAECL